MSEALRRWWVLALVLGLTFQYIHAAEQTLATSATNKTLLRAAQVRALSRAEADSGWPVRLNAVVTFSDSDAGLLFVEDDTGGIFVAPQEPLAIPAGTRVEVNGVAQPGSHLPFVAKAILVDLGTAAFPKPQAVTFAQLATGNADSNWIQTEGVVRSVQIIGNSVRLVLAAGGKRILVRVAQAAEAFLDMTNLVDARVRVQGVAGAPNVSSREDLLLDLHVPHPRFVEIRTRATPPLRSPLRNTVWLRQQFPTNSFVHRVRIRGVLENEPGRPTRLRDDTGSIDLASESMALGGMTNATVEVVGFPDGGPTSPRLENVRVSLLSRGRMTNAVFSGPLTTNQVEEFLPVLTEIAEVRRLPVEEAARGYPVRVRAVVTFLQPFPDRTYRFFVQDGTAGIFVRADSVEAGCRVGSAVELEGVTDPGDYAPVIKKSRMTMVGKSPLPPAQATGIEELLTGRKDSQRVSVQGIIVRAQIDGATMNLRLLVGSTLVEALLTEVPNELDTVRLVDAAVRVAGVCSTSFNSKRQLLGVILNVPRWEDIQIIKPPPEDPFAVPLQSIRSLTQFDLAEETHHRVRVQGIATLVIPGLGAFLQEKNDGLFVLAVDGVSLQTGDLTEVIGFPQRGPSGAELIEPRLRRLGAGSIPQAQEITGAAMASGDVNNVLVTLEARLLEQRAGTDLSVLVCQKDNLVFEALGQAPAFHTSLQSIQAGSLLRLSGVWAIRRGALPQTQVGQLYLRSPADIEVLERPSWWTPRRAVRVGGGLLILVLAALAWVALLRKQVRERTAQNQKALSLLEASIAQSPAGILIADAPDVTIRWANSTALGMRGQATELLTELEVHQRNSHWQVCKPDGTVCPPAESPLSRAVRRGEITRDEELVVRSTEGETHWVLANASPIRDAEGNITAGIVVYHDITERKQAEEERVRLQNQLLQAQKMESVGRLAGGVAHDFNNMLQAILGNAALAALEPSLSPESREHLVEIKKAAERSADLTRQLLAFARKQPVRPKVLDLNDTVSGMLKMLQRLLGENIQLAWLPGSNLWPVKIDPSQVDQMLANLTVNARDAIAGVGHITIRTANVLARDVPLRPNVDATAADYVLLSVDDDGCGMDAETQAHLFEPFFTTKAAGKGTGLGLATVYGIAKQNGGFIEVQSKPGRGSSFQIYLPRTMAEPETSASPPSPKSWRGTETVLLVEDERQVLELSQRILRQHGYGVLAAGSPAEGIRLAQTHAGPIHLLLTDVIMPGMDGRELSACVAALKPGLKCIFMSGYTADVIARQGVLEKGVHFLQKPFTVADLTQRIREALATP